VNKKPNLMKKNASFEEYLKEFRKRVGYKINEVRYNSVGISEDEYDNLPDNVYMTRDGYSTPNAQAYLDEVDDELKDTEDVENPEPLAVDADEPPTGPPGGGEPEGTPVEAERGVDEIQNDIIKHNISALKAIYDQIDQLNRNVDMINNKIDVLSTDVEEVREPTNSEKLLKRKESSYPYYFNLNDLWGGNWFEDKYSLSGESNESDELQKKGIRKLEDGTYAADFDNLSKVSDFELKKTFNTM